MYRTFDLWYTPTKSFLKNSPKQERSFLSLNQKVRVQRKCEGQLFIMTDFSKALFHCSGIINLMSNGQGNKSIHKTKDAREELEKLNIKYGDIKNKETKAATELFERICKIENVLKGDEDNFPLTDGIKGVLRRYYMWEKYKKYSVSTDDAPDQFVKGKFCEEASIQMLSSLDGNQYVKNLDRLTNDFLCGKPDIVQKNTSGEITYVLEVKTPRDMTSFADYMCDDITNQYWWQIQGYLDLTDLKKGELSACLISNPPEVIEKHIQRLVDEGYDIDCDELRKNLTYDEIPFKDRRIKFEVERDDDAIARLHTRIIRCREYLMELDEKWGSK